MAERKATVVVDVVEGKNTSKKQLSEQERFAKEMNKRLFEDSKRISNMEVALEEAETRKKKAISDKFLKSIESSSRATAQRMRSMFSDVFAGTFLGMTASNALSAGANRLFAGLQEAFQKSLDFSTLKISLAQFEGSMEAAERRIQSLMKVAAETPGLSFLSAIEGQKRLMAIGFAGETATKILTGLSRVRVLSGSTKEDFDAMIVNLVQIASGGQKVTQEIREMATRMPAIAKVIKDEFGGIDDRLNDIDPKVFVERLAEAASKVQADFNSTALAVENLQDSFDRLYIAVGSIIEQNPSVLAAINTLTQDVDRNSTALMDNESELRRNASGWVSWGARTIITIANMGDALTSTLSAAGNFVAGWANSLRSMFFLAFAAVPGAINKLVIPALQGFMSMLSAVPGLGHLANIPIMPIANPALDEAKFYNQAASFNFQDASKAYQIGDQRIANRWRIFQQELERTRGMNLNRPDTGVPYGPGGTRLNTNTGPLQNAGGGRLPKTKSSKVNLKLKDEMTEALDIAAEYGVIVTSGKDGKHNADSRHYTGQAFDIRTTGLAPGVADALLRDLRDAGYNVRDERRRPFGQKEWSAPHLHVGPRAKSTANLSVRRRAAGLTNPTIVATDSYGVGAFVGPDDKNRPTVFNNAPTMREDFGLDMDATNRDTSALEQNIRLTRDLADAIFELNENTKAEIFWRRYLLGDYPELNQQRAEEIKAGWERIDQMEKLRKDQADQQQWIDDYRREQQQLFEETARGWEDLLTNLASGNFRSIWDQFRRDMLQQFIRPASQYLASLFGGGGANGFSLANIFTGGGGFGGFGGGGGIGGTPNFNPASNFVPGGSGGGFLSQIFGGGGGQGGFLGNLFGGGGFFGDSGLRSASGRVILDPNVVPGSRGGGGGLGGLFGGMFGPRKNILTGGMSKAAGIGAGIGTIAMLAGSAIGGRFGNTLQMAGMGAQLGSMFGPWGTAIGAGVGALIGLFTGGDDATKKLKQAASSEFGINVKDKSVLKQLKQIGEAYFGKGNVGANATSVVRTEEGMNILRAYADASGQSGLKIDRLNMGDPTWSGNQFRSKFGGFRAMGGPVTAGYSYIVGERGPERFTAPLNGNISPTVGSSDVQMRVIAQLEETIHMLAAKLETMSPGDVVRIGAPQASREIYDANNREFASGGRRTESTVRKQGMYR